MFKLKQSGFIPIIVIVLGLIIIGSATIIIRNAGFSEPQFNPSLGFQGSVSAIIKPKGTPKPSLSKHTTITLTPTTKPSSTTSNSTSSNNSSANQSSNTSPTNTPTSTNTSTPTLSYTPSPTPVPTSSTKPTLQITNGPYAGGASPCFDVSAYHANCYELSAEYVTDDNLPYQRINLSSVGACYYRGTVCTSQTGTHTIKIRPYTVSTYLYGDTFSKSYTYP